MSIEPVFHAQARACEQLGSPFTARILDLLPDLIAAHPVFGPRITGWTGDIGPSGSSIPLRLCGGLHHLVLTAQCPELAACYPPNACSTDALTGSVRLALDTHTDALNAALELPPQTNETGRSAVMIAAAHLLEAAFGLPFNWCELGASAGLNLWFDRFRLDLGDQAYGPADASVVLRPDWSGAQPIQASPRILHRAGCDLNPCDLNRDDQRLLSYFWPDQQDRLLRARAAIEIAKHASPNPVVEKTAETWLPEVLAVRPQNAITVICNTIAWQYFPGHVQQACRRDIEAEGAAATGTTPLAWLQMEADANAKGAKLTMDIWPGAHKVALGRADYHGRWIDWACPRLEI